MQKNEYPKYCIGLIFNPCRLQGTPAIKKATKHDSENLEIPCSLMHTEGG
jgi:hypothetical protein